MFDLRFAEIDYTVTVGRHSDGRPGEVFISCVKAGSAVANLARDVAVLASLGLQHGVPLDTMVSALTREENGSASGVGGAVLDAVARLEADAGAVFAMPDRGPATPPPAREPIGFLTPSRAGTGFSGDVCSTCRITARAQNFPTRPITVIAPFPPGGSSDTVIRVMSATLKDALGQSIVVDSKTGANGSIGARVAARSRLDGSTLLIGSMPVFAVNPWLYKSLPYDPQKDFDLLTQPVRTPNARVVTPSFPANTIPD